MFDILNKIEEEYPHHTLGCNKEGEIFVDGINTHIVLTYINNSNISDTLKKEVFNVTVNKIKNELLKQNFIHEEVKEE